MKTIKPIHKKFYTKDLNIAYEMGRADMIKEVIDFISDRGFREANYEISELYNWLQKQKEKLKALEEKK